ncbi:hypothetical protein [Kitasatospora aureofaciens]|uniref:hypothetical protein n=1 Tax=Kitasatospora aureofaciens TaxID=1894 RepID=UPI00068AFCE3|nr:hypothetical protein [Kitasatospora aureofaciens]
MKGTGKAPLVGLALAAGLMTVVLGVSARWPVWLWAVPAVIAMVLAILLASTRSPEPESEPADSDEPRWEETRVDGVALPSRVPDYDFRFSAAVWWRPIPNATGLVHADPASLAIETVLARARELTEREVPQRLGLLLHRLNGVLGTQIRDTSGLVEAMGGQVELRLSEDDRERLGRLSEVRKTEEVWEHERRYEQSKRAYLGGDVLRSPGSAVVWWLARHEDKVTEAVDMIGPLAQLSAAANDEAVDELYEHLIPQPRSQSIPFLDEVAPSRRRPDDDGMGGVETGPSGHPGPAGPSSGPMVVGPLNQLLDDIDLARDSPAREVYARRVAEFTDAMGLPEPARLIRESLLGDEGGCPGRVSGHEQPAGAADGGPGMGWTGINGAVNGTSSGAGRGTPD